jgi:hypothetical protein
MNKRWINLKILIPNGTRKEEVVEQKESNSGQHSKELNAAPFPESSLVCIRIRIDLALPHPDPFWECGPGSRSRSKEIDQY